MSVFWKLGTSTRFLGTALHTEIENSQWVAPMPDICQQWQEKGQVDFDWYFDQIQKFGANRVLFNSLKMNSELFDKLNQKTKEKNLAPVHVVTTEQFCELENLSDLLATGVQFAILIYSPLSTELICRVEENKEFLKQFQFVILARKDWNVRNCYRSIPHFMRERLFVDFPVSLHPSDPFYEASELANAQQKLQEDFLETKVSSFCPHLALINEWSQKNISHFSQPRKLTKNKPQVSLIALDADDLKTLESSKVVAENPENFEILITRVAGQKTKVIPKFKSVTTTKYWAHSVDVNKSVSEMALANFTATQADGDVLLFLSGTDSSQLDILFPLILEGEANFSKLLARKDIFVFDKQNFLTSGGFDELIRSWEGQKTEGIVRFYGQDRATSLLSEDWGEKIKVSNEITDRIVLAHRYSKQIKNFDFLDRVASSNRLEMSKVKNEKRWYVIEDAYFRYKSLFSWDPKVIFEGHLAYVKNPLSALLRKIVHLPLKLYGISVRSYWFLFHMAYPFRKVYYFTHFQYEKRILGLHKRATGGQN